MLAIIKPIMHNWLAKMICANLKDLIISKTLIWFTITDKSQVQEPSNLDWKHLVVHLILFVVNSKKVIVT